MAWKRLNFCCWDLYLLFVSKWEKKKREKNTSFYGLVSKKVFRHLQWVMWKINSLESKAKFVWPQKGRERGSLQGNDKNLKILISICHGREQEKQAIGTSSWSFPLAGMLNSREKTNISVRFAFSEKIKSSPSCLVLCHWQPLVLFETPKKAELSVLVVCGKKEKSYGGCFTLGRDFRLQQDPACALVKGCVQPLGLEEDKGTVMLHVHQSSSRSACIR